jgi:intein/homing endonuclease
MLANMGIKSDIKEDYNKKYDHTYFNVNVCLEDLKEIYAGGSVKYSVLNFDGRKKERYNRSNHVPKSVWDEFLNWRNKHVRLSDNTMKDGTGKFDISSDFLYSYRKRELLTKEVAYYIASSKIISKDLDLYKIARMIVDGFWFQKISNINVLNEQKTVYDVTVPVGHSFIANSIVSHNSFMLMETATYAMQMGYKVWFISLEMTRNQVVRRMWQQWMDSVAEEQTVTIPYFDEQGNICERFADTSGKPDVVSQ